MAYTYTTSWGDGIILAPCLQVLCAEIAQRYPDAVNVGEIGNAAHQTEGYGSDHNPFITHGGKRYVRAIDIGGDESIQAALFAFFMGLYVKRDPRIYPYGYVHKDNVITKWFGNGDTKYQPNLDTHYDEGDVGHLHISVTQANGNNPSPSGWVSSLDSRTSWGLASPITDTGDDLDMDVKTLQAAVVGAQITNPKSKKTGTLGERLLDIEMQQDAQQKQLDELVANVRKLVAKP